MAEVPLPAGVLLRTSQLAADGFLCASTNRAGCEGARRGCVAAGCFVLTLGLNTRKAGASCKAGLERGGWVEGGRCCLSFPSPLAGEGAERQRSGRGARVK